MRFKLFESFESFYSEISREDLSELMYKSSTYFTDKDINYIKGILTHLELSLEIISVGGNKIWKIIIYKEATNEFMKSILATIFKIKDEWFLTDYGGSMRISHNFKIKRFKCDQIEGLVKNLEDALANGDGRWDERHFRRI